MFCFGVFVILASLPSGYFSGKIEKLPPFEEARLGDVEVLCDWFCSDDLYDYDSDEILPGPGGRASPRIFCDLCEDKNMKPTGPPTSTIKTELDGSSPTVSSPTTETSSATSEATTTTTTTTTTTQPAASAEAATEPTTTTTLAPESAPAPAPGPEAADSKPARR